MVAIRRDGWIRNIDNSLNLLPNLLQQRSIV